MHNYKLVIFDWDGTLMDSVSRIVSSMQTSAEKLGLPKPSSEQAQQIIGLSLLEGIHTLFPNITSAHADRLILAYKNEFKYQNETPMPMFDNAIKLLSNLKADKKLLAIATGKARDGLTHVLEVSNTADLFHTTVCGDEHSSKPSPDMLYHLLKHFDVEVNDAVMIGDSCFDLEMALNAGIDSIGVTYGVHDAKTLSKYKPKAIVDNIAELEQLLLSK